MKTIAQRIQEGLTLRQCKQADLVQKTGISKGALSSYISGRYIPKQNNLSKIAKALDVSEAWLNGEDVSPTATDNTLLTRIYPINLKKFPLLGENQESFLLGDANIPADFCIKAHGESMIHARIFDGDIVFVKEQKTVESGELAVIQIGEEISLKRVYHYPNEARIALMSENPSFLPIVLIGEETKTLQILGKVVAFQSYIK